MLLRVEFSRKATKSAEKHTAVKSVPVEKKVSL